MPSLGHTVRECPLASAAVGGDDHSLCHSVACEPVVSDCYHPHASKSARLGPGKVKRVRDLGRLSCVVYVERLRT